MSGQDAIPVTALDPQQLSNLRERLESDIQRLSSSSLSLQKVASVFAQAGRAINRLAESTEGQTIMLPLTSALYVSGQLDCVTNVLVDIGTGYFVEMTTEEGVAFCKRKVDKLKGSIDELAEAVRHKQTAMMQVTQVLQEKVAAAQAQASMQTPPV